MSSNAQTARRLRTSQRPRSIGDASPLRLSVGPQLSGSIQSTKTDVLSSPLALLSCVSYAVSSTLVTLLNKIVFSHSRFHYPWTTLATQNILSVILILVGHAFGLTTAGRYSPRVAKDMSIPIVCFILFIFTNAQSMRYINIPVLTVWKSLGPMFVTLFERFYFGDEFSSRVYVAMSLIVLSAFVTAINDLEYSSVGYLWAAGNVFANVMYLASLRKYLRTPNVSALDKTFHSNLLSLIPMIMLAVVTDEVYFVGQDFRTTSSSFKIVFALSGFLTTAVCATAFWTISLTNGSTLSFIGGLNKIPMILISLLIFDTHMSWAGWFGVTLGVLAGFVFMRAKATVANATTKATQESVRLEPTSSTKGSSASYGLLQSSSTSGTIGHSASATTGTATASSRLLWAGVRKVLRMGGADATVK